MDKRVILAVAGSGKTHEIIRRLDLEKRSLIVTYTNNNHENLKSRIIKKFGYMPQNIKLYTYFPFLHSFCYKPFLLDKFKTKGMSFDKKPFQYAKTTEIRYFLDVNRQLFSNRLAYLLTSNAVLINKVMERLSKYFDNFFIDEIQDFAANDFNFIGALVKSNISILYVGDFFQHTFDTSNDGNTRKKLHEDYNKYLLEFEKFGLIVDTVSLNKSWRCSGSLCDFVSAKFNIPIQSQHTHITKIVHVTDVEKIKEILQNDKIIKLFYQNHIKFNGYSNNWGKSKGLDKYHDVCVVLNKTTFNNYINNELQKSATSTRNKLYVAITRAKGDIYFIEERLVKSLKQ